MSLQLRVIGFAGAAPLLGACSSYAVSDHEHVVLLDCGPGTLKRVWRLGLLPSLDAIVISHMHLDHMHLDHMLDLLLFSGHLVREELGGRRPALHVPADGGS
jgi:ribonuclease BN (tRNA processing enzyme)